MLHIAYARGLGSKNTMQTHGLRALFISFVLAVIGIRQAAPLFIVTSVSQHEPLVLPEVSLVDAQVTVKRQRL